MKHEVNPEAVRKLGYRIADLYAEVCIQANSLPEADKAALFRIMQNIWTPFMEGVEELGQLGEHILVETSDE